ncbi:uncharacterized protein LOC114361425 [Ostrinia furnacalis]|uniref:uncharacterized protein LOC114361425 n=1 Tax=Ostrinia furnacalis TaxID=93504 RepID=UPI00103A92DE|nr:uncharacterized protein LOC114361425 [Ostrinia furnacalis]
MRAVHFKTKYIRSDPCTCTSVYSEAVNKKHSRLHSKKFNKEIDSIPTTIESKAIKAKRCVCECNIVRKPNKSLQRLKNAKEKVTRSIKGSISKIENTIRVKRDSIIMFRNKLRRKRALKKYECEPSYCIPEECAPPKCYEKIKTRLNDIKSDIKRSYHDLRAIGSGISFRKAPKYEIEPFCDPEACEPPKCYEKFKTQLNDMKSNIKRSFHDLRAIGSGISFKRSKKEELEPYYCLPEDCDPPKCYEKIKMRLNDIKSDIKKSYHDLRVIGSGISFKRTPKKEKAASKRKSKPVICTCEAEAEPAVPTENYEHEKSIWSRKRKTSPSVKRNGLVINIEPSVLSKKKTTKPKSPRNVCECDKEEQSKTPVSPTYELGRYTFPSTDRKFPRECEASMCIPGECDYRKCAEILKAQSQTSSTHISQKSVGSGTMKHKQQSQSIDVNEQHTKSENIEPKRQVVRIASNFSFSIEFYKDQKNEITELDKPQQETIRKFRSRNKKTGSRKTKFTYPRKIRSRNKSIQSNLKRLCCIPTFHALRRCFCTLQLKDAATLEKSTVGDQIEKTTTISDCACEPKPKKSTQTKKKPFPCDPYFDRGENCDSAICEKRVRDKQEQTKNKHSGLKERKRKHCIGTTPQLTTKTCASQCNIFSKLSSKSSDPRSKKMKFSQNELPKRTEYHNGIDDTTNRSVVRIGSSFRFNIEFYKETEPSFDATPLKNDENFEHSDYTSKHQMRQKCLRTAKCRHNTTQSKLNLSDGFCSMASQSSFTQKDQEINSNKAVKKKPVKKVSKTVCECDITTQTSASGAYVRPPVLPQYYTGGQCNDLTCVKKIDTQSHTTNECRHRKNNTVCCSKSRSRSIKTLTDTGSSKRQMSRETKMLKSLSSKDFATGQDTSHHRQSVNIGSSFSFNIEFSKDTSSTKQHNIVANKVTNNHIKQKCKECVCKAIDAPSLRQPQICKNNERKEYGTATRRKSYRPVARKTSCVACGPEKMVSEIIGTDIQPVKCKTQKTQSNFYEPSIKTKHKKQPKSAMKAPTRQLFMSEIYNTHVYDSCECLQSKRPFLRSRKKSIVILYPEKNLPSNTFSSFTKMHKEGLNLQPMQSKQKTSRINKIITHRKKHKFKATQTKENCLNKSTSCKCYINRLKKKAKDSVDNASHCSTNMTYKKEQCSLQNKRGKRKKGRKIGPNPQKMQQVSQMKKVNIQNLSQISKERAQSKDQEDKKLDEQCTKSKANDATVKRSRIIRCIMRFSFLSKKKRFDGNQATHTRDINLVNNLKPNPIICSNEKCETAMIETIMPYCKKKFVKKCSRTCLSKECKLLIKSTAKKYTKDSKIGSKNPLFSKLSQRLSRKTSDCNEVCLKKAKTNLLKNSTPSQRLTKSFIKKYVPRNTENVKHIHDTLEMNEGALECDGVAMKRPCCVCPTKQYSDTNKLTFETQIPKRTNLDKPKNINRTKVNADIANTIISCSCGSNICKKQSKTRSPNVSKESNVVCLCHHECQCPAILKKMEDSKKAKELKQKTKRLKQKQKMQRKKQKSNRKNKVNSDLLQLYSETSDTRLVADSCLDLTKMSAEIMWNLMKVPFKVISNPKDSFENFKMALRHPTDIKCPDGVTTKAIGIKQKFAAMRMTKNAKDMLESFTVTNYLIHAFDDDSTKRLRALKSRKQMKKRAREDFGCSPFMASLRKRPFLWVYDKCPSFYPQFISLLSGWRQFIDMLLFLSAIVVWSPCIFGIELCRAIMCCCLCTG